MLLGTIILTTDRGIAGSSQVLLQTSYGIDAVSLGTSVIEKAQELAFDEHTKDSTWINSLTGFTAPNKLGQENNDPTDLDDYDDFNGLPSVGYRIEPDSLSTGFYKVKTQVHYVLRNSSGNFVYSTSSPTWSKELDVWVWNTADSLDTVKMSDVFSYWY